MTPSERYSKVGSGVWDEAWTDDAKFVYLYLKTCKHRTTEGLFKLPLEYAIADLGWQTRRFKNAFHELQRAGAVAYDQELSICLLVDALEVQSPVNGNQATAAVRAVKKIPACPLRDRWIGIVDLTSERLSKALREQLPEWFIEPFSQPFAQPFQESAVGSFTNPPSPTPSPTQLRGVA